MSTYAHTHTQAEKCTHIQTAYGRGRCLQIMNITHLTVNGGTIKCLSAVPTGDDEGIPYRKSAYGICCAAITSRVRAAKVSLMC